MESVGEKINNRPAPTQNSRNGIDSTAKENRDQIKNMGASTIPSLLRDVKQIRPRIS
jgi:hypothetical protein